MILYIHLEATFKLHTSLLCYSCIQHKLLFWISNDSWIGKGASNTKNTTNNLTDNRLNLFDLVVNLKNNNYSQYGI